MSQSPPVSILLVEDDESAQEVLGTLLKLRFPDCRIHCAGDGKTGLDLAELFNPDIVITDINMPEMDGIRMLAAIHVLCPDTRFIVVTAHSDKQITEKITTMDMAVDIVAKPIDLSILLAMIERPRL
jgi:CheY-like chemotaxis protein